MPNTKSEIEKMTENECETTTVKKTEETQTSHLKQRKGLKTDEDDKSSKKSEGLKKKSKTKKSKKAETDTQNISVVRN